MKMKVLSLTAVSLVVVLMTPLFSNARNDEAIHEYSVGVEGTQGALLRMYLVTKPTGTSAPTLQEEIITIPFETEFKASTFYVWFHTLGGDEPMSNYRIRSVYRIDGELQGTGFGLNVKKGNQVKTGFGNL